jgi:hypothetical protein
MTLLTASDVQLLGVGLGLSEVDLDTLIAREEAEIVRRYGANYSADTPLTERVKGGQKSIYLKRPIGSVTSISEYLFLGDSAPQVLSSTDYYVWNEEGRIERVYGYGYGSGKWGVVVSAVYTPVDDTDLRKQVLIELLRITTEQSTTGGGVSGLGFSISGSSDNSGTGWANQRNAQYNRLGWFTR